MPVYAQLGSLADCLRLTVPGARVTRSLGRPVNAGALARAGEMLVTRTVQMLMLGSGIGFDRLRLSLKDIPDRWQLSAVDQT